MKEIKKMLTFDDVLLKPHYSEILPSEVNVNSVLSKNFDLNIPIISAGMDTVTEIEMAYNMALNGGIGTIHKNLSISQQSNMIKQLKKIVNGYSYSIMAFDSSTKIFSVKSMVFNEYIDDCIFVINNNKIVNIVTKEDIEELDFKENDSLESLKVNKIFYADINSKPEDILNMMDNNRVDNVILVSKDSVVAVAKRKWLKPYLECEIPLLDNNKSVKVLGAIGVSEDSLNRAKSLFLAGVDGIIIDCAHGHSKRVIDLARQIKKDWPTSFVIAGNVVTKEAIRDLAVTKVDAIKVGIGPGSICTTRIISGVGVPQFSAILETVEEAKKYNISIIADGGLKTSGDIVKALAAGANAVMIGSLIAGCEESPSEKVYLDGKVYKKYRGMGSASAMKAGSADRYGQESLKKFVPEGIEGLITYKGHLKDTLYSLVGGLKSGMGYMGAKNLYELEQNAEFIQQTGIGLTESNTHSVSILSNTNHNKK